MQILDLDLPPKIRHLRTNQLKRHQENRAAAIFSHGISKVTGTKVYLAPVEASDYDFVTFWQFEDTRHFCPVQLKEWVPEELNPSLELNELISSTARKYPSDTRTALAIHVNRALTLDLTNVQVPQLGFSALWLFGATSEDQQNWTIWGDFKSSPLAYQFSYPSP